MNVVDEGAWYVEEIDAKTRDRIYVHGPMTKLDADGLVADLKKDGLAWRAYENVSAAALFHGGGRC